MKYNDSFIRKWTKTEAKFKSGLCKGHVLHLYIKNNIICVYSKNKILISYVR
jgi:hypothetical protein